MSNSQVINEFMNELVQFNTYPCTVYDNETHKINIAENGNRLITSADCKLMFRKSDGMTWKWGKTLEDNPTHLPYGNEIADIEITKACNGIRIDSKTGVRIPCPWCYKSNTNQGTYMNFETFKHIFGLLDAQKTMTQIAFGVDAEASDMLNPDIWKIFEYTKENGVTPNVTVADITKQTAERLVSLMGAIAVSYYPLLNKDCCYDTVKLLVDQSKKQNKNIAINIHALVCEETFDSLFELLKDIKTDKRLEGLNAVVLLSLKQKGRGVYFNRVNDDQFKQLIDKCFETGVNFGLDSCGANKFINAIKDRKDARALESFVESCESSLFSCFINDKGMFYPCSFMEKEGEWESGIDMTKCTDFVKDVWYEDRVVNWRKDAIEQINCHGCNRCKFFNV